MTNYLTPVLWFSNETLNFALPDLNLTKNRKTTNNSATMDIPSESNKQHLDKVLTFIGLIDAGYLTCSMTVQKVQIQTCQIWRKIENCQTCWKASVLFPKVVTWWSTGYGVHIIDLNRSWLVDLPFRYFQKVKIFACPDLSSLTDDRKLSNLLETIHSTS